MKLLFLTLFSSLSFSFSHAYDYINESKSPEAILESSTQLLNRCQNFCEIDELHEVTRLRNDLYQLVGNYEIDPQFFASILDNLNEIEHILIFTDY